jgi:aminopeptidase
MRRPFNPTIFNILSNHIRSKIASSCLSKQFYYTDTLRKQRYSTVQPAVQPAANYAITPQTPLVLQELLPAAITNCSMILHESVCVNSDSDQILVLSDSSSELSRFLAQVYTNIAASKPNFKFIDYNSTEPAQIKETINSLPAGSLVVAIQSGQFQLSGYRLRLELFQRKLKIIEYVHLEHITGPQINHYISALGFNPKQNKPLAEKLKTIIDSAKSAKIVSRDGSELIYSAGFEPAKVNIGDFSGLNSVGSTYPVGEIFTESNNFSAVNGLLCIAGFPDLTRKLHVCCAENPIQLEIKESQIISVRGGAAVDLEKFQQILDLIRVAEGKLLIREFGVGMNGAMGFNGRIVSDITAFERQRGFHVSLGAKHTVFKKPEIRARDTRFHLDLFVQVKEIWIEGKLVLDQQGKFCVE